jgi:hypothetical protein
MKDSIKTASCARVGDLLRSKIDGVLGEGSAQATLTAMMLAGVDLVVLENPYDGPRTMTMDDFVWLVADGSQA